MTSPNLHKYSYSPGKGALAYQWSQEELDSLFIQLYGSVKEGRRVTDEVNSKRPFNDKPKPDEVVKQFFVTPAYQVRVWRCHNLPANDVMDRYCFDFLDGNGNLATLPASHTIISVPDFNNHFTFSGLLASMEQNFGVDVRLPGETFATFGGNVLVLRRLGEIDIGFQIPRDGKPAGAFSGAVSAAEGGLLPTN
ncbi:hypothetical protein Hypma_000636 [Hypsizygus marmoreus]|uniref:Uncharacterized protein n=1 Tax=Hypsizygus marmoreus TaxID=39966 RepID=A0A369J872_HYPMA|nr:hypothetical protein Hypma_000636 [Hypsizygus marmoreus]